jgi:hypothetical protein
LTREGFETSVTPGLKSQFDVLRDGELVFSKQEARRFPDRDEVLASLRR